MHVYLYQTIEYLYRLECYAVVSHGWKIHKNRDPRMFQHNYPHMVCIDEHNKRLSQKDSTTEI